MIFIFIHETLLDKGVENDEGYSIKYTDLKFDDLIEVNKFQYYYSGMQDAFCARF